MRYKYMAVVYNGWRHFNHYTYEGVKVCAIVACENEHILSCGKRLNNATDDVSGVTFLDISIEGNFSDASFALTMPTSLDFKISSLPTSQFAFHKAQDEYQMSLIGEHSELLAFGIFARDFRYSSKDNPNSSVAATLSASLIVLSLLWVLLQ